MKKEVTKRFWGKVNKNGPIPKHCPELGQCWIWTAAKNLPPTLPYGRFKTEGVEEKARRVSWKITFGSIKKLTCVCHGDRHWTRLNPNSVLRGENSGVSKLTEFEVIKIRRLYNPKKRGLGSYCLAKMFGVSKPNVISILRRETWAHV